jgi:hypothetical protein
MRSIGIPFMDKGRLRAFLKDPLLNTAEELLNLSRNQSGIMTTMVTGHYHLAGQLLKVGLISSPKCTRCKKKAPEMASHVLLWL